MSQLICRQQRPSAIAAAKACALLGLLALALVSCISVGRDAEVGCLVDPRAPACTSSPAAGGKIGAGGSAALSDGAGDGGVAEGGSGAPGESAEISRPAQGDAGLGGGG